MPNPQPMSAWMADLAVGGAILLAGVSLLLFVVGLISYARVRHGRLLWVAFAFLGLFAEGVILAWLSYASRTDLANDGSFQLPGLTLLNLGVVLALYLAVLKR
jgi:hypothetical protein